MVNWRLSLMLVMTLLVRRLGSKGKRLSIENNFMIILRSQLKNIPSFAFVIVNGDIAWGVLRGIMEFSFACLSAILAILKSFNLNAELAIDFGGSICHYLFLSDLTCYFHDSSCMNTHPVPTCYPLNPVLLLINYFRKCQIFNYDDYFLCLRS